AMPSVSSLLATLTRGANGSEVSTLQQLLTRAGYDTGGVDGDFGAETRDALIRFQREHGLNPDGVAGPATWRALSAAAPVKLPSRAGDGIMNLEAGSTGNAVVVLQKALKAAGYDVGSADGSFGPTTDAALRRFQAAHHLEIDG